MLALCFGNVLALPLSLGGTGERRVIMAGMGPLPHRHRVREISPVSSTVRRRGRSMQRLRMMRAVIMRSIIHFFPTEFLVLSVICISRWRGIRHVKKQIVAFAEKNGCTATMDEIRSFFAEKSAAAGELSEEELFCLEGDELLCPKGNELLCLTGLYVS